MDEVTPSELVICSLSYESNGTNLEESSPFVAYLKYLHIIVHAQFQICVSAQHQSSYYECGVCNMPLFSNPMCYNVMHHSVSSLIGCFHVCIISSSLATWSYCGWQQMVEHIKFPNNSSSATQYPHLNFCLPKWCWTEMVTMTGLSRSGMDAQE